jgi:hypothetical protein
MLERVTGIEPVTQPWQGRVLPLAPHPLGGKGVEPTRRLITNVGLAIRCLTIRPTFLYVWLPSVGSNHGPTD